MSAVKDAQWIAAIFEPVRRAVTNLPLIKSEADLNQAGANLQRKLDELAGLIKDRLQAARTHH